MFIYSIYSELLYAKVRKIYTVYLSLAYTKTHMKERGMRRDMGGSQRNENNKQKPRLTVISPSTLTTQ